MPCAPDIIEILDHTHAILGSISLIQTLQPCAREVVTSGAVFDSAVSNLLAVPDITGDAGF
jgi:hypothetical protein